MRPRTWGRPAPTIVTGSCRCAIRCNAVISAASSFTFTYWSSSMKSAMQVPSALAAAPTASNRLCRSISKSPLSANPGSGSKSKPTSMSWYFTRRAPTNPARARKARCASCLAVSFLDRRNKAARNSGASIDGSERSSAASARKAAIPAASASSLNRSSNTVFPTPRKPTIIMLLLGRPIRIRSSAIRAAARISWRPTSSGGCVPAPGAYGLRMGSIAFSL